MKKHGKWAIIMAHKVIILYRLYMPYYFLGTFTEYPYLNIYMSFPLFISSKNNIKLFYAVSYKTYKVQTEHISANHCSGQMPKA